MHLSDHNIAVVLLAAGRGTRMDLVRTGGTPKLLLPLSDAQPIVRHAVLNALALSPSLLLVVVRPDLPEIADALSDLPLTCIPNPQYTEGIGTSLAAGIRALPPQIEAALIMLGDEPAVSPAITHALLHAYLLHSKPITMPLYGDQAGPPTLFSRSIFPTLSRLTGDAGGRQLIARYPHLVHAVPLPEADRPRDIDTPQDYTSLL